MDRRSGWVGQRDHEVIKALGAEGRVTTVLAFIELDEAQWGQRASVEGATAFEVRDTDRDVIDDDATDWDAVRLPRSAPLGQRGRHGAVDVAQRLTLRPRVDQILDPRRGASEQT
jgi:hypothetical protein